MNREMICDTSRHPIAISARAAWMPSLHMSPVSGQLRINRHSLIGRVIELDEETIVCQASDGEVFSSQIADGFIQRICNLRSPAVGDVSTLGHLAPVAS